MKTNIIIGLVLTLTVFRSSSQCLTKKHIDIANKVFDGKLKAKDFEGNLFLTIDTVNSESLVVPSLFTEFSNPLELIENFNQAMQSIGIVGDFFNYYEVFDNSFFNSPLHQSFLVNNAKFTYKIDIWNNPDNITKISGLSIVKYNELYDRTKY